MSDEAKTFDAISVLMDWYAEYGKKEQSIEDLLEARDRLATHSYRLAEIVGDAFINYNGAYFISKINIEKDIQKMTENGLKYNKAGTEAFLKNERHYKNKMLTEGIAKKADILLRQVNHVLQAMQQRISFLKAIKPHSDAQT